MMWVGGRSGTAIFRFRRSSADAGPLARPAASIWDAAARPDAIIAFIFMLRSSLGAYILRLYFRLIAEPL